MVDAFEQVARAGIPAPPEVARQLFEGVQPFGQGLVHHHAVPVGLLGEKLLAHEVDLLVAVSALVQHGAVGADDRTFDSLGVSLLVGGEEVFPERRFGDFVGRHAHLVHVLVVQQAEVQQRLGDLLFDLLIVVVVAQNDLHARMLALFGRPETESGQRRGDRRHGEGHRFERRVSPRFVVGGEYGHVHAHQQLVVILVEDAVGLVEVGRNEDHLHLRIGRGQDAAVEGVNDRVAALVFEVVGRVFVLPAVDGLRRIGQMRLQVRARTAVGGGHGDVGQHLTFEPGRCGQFLERFDEYVDALVAEFVASAGADDQRLLGELFAQTRFGHRDHRFAGFGAFRVVLLAGPDEIVFEAVGRDAVGFAAQQEFALVGRDVADRDECVVVGSGGLLDRVFGHDIELAGQIVGVEFGQVGVERQVVARDAAAHDRGVRGEERRHIGCVAAQVETARRGHPFVEMGGDLVGRGAEVLDIGGDHRACGVAEEHGFDVVPLTRNRIDVVGLPEFLEYFVLAGNQRGEVHQYGRRFALDFPVSRADADAFGVESLTPCLQQVGILLEFGVHAFVLQVGADEDVALVEFPDGRLRFGRDYRMDAADFVADLPTYLEQVIGG